MKFVEWLPEGSLWIGRFVILMVVLGNLFAGFVDAGGAEVAYKKGAY